MKKLLSVLSSSLHGGVRGGLLFLALLTASSLWAYDFQSGDLYYNITSDSTVEVTEGNYSGEIIIPETVTYNGIAYSVTSIGYGAFDYCSSLTSVTIGNSVTSIGNQVFEDCHSLVSIAIGKNLTSIGTNIFEGCYSLSSIKIDNDNIYYDSRENCNAIIKTETNALLYGCRSTTIPNSVTSIEKNAFKNCSSLTSIIIPNSVTSIGNSAFYGTTFTKDNFINNSSLDAEANNYWGARIVEQEIQDLLINGKTVVDCRPHATIVSIPDTITTIGGHAFADCPFLISVTIPNSVTHIGDYAFYHNSSLISVNIPNSVTSIGDYAFRGCSSLIAIDIPNSLTEIAHGMFEDCSSLATVTIPNSVTSIDSWAFSSCTSLTSITIPNSVTRIGSYAFEYCRSLTAITIPESVTSIGGDAFSYCRSLTAITIPESVTDIGSGAFESCSSLTSVVWNAKKCGNRNSYNDGYTHFYFEIEFADSTSYSYEEIDEFVKHFHLDEGNIINDSPFNGCDAIKSFNFGENVEFIPDGLCYGLDSITSITIPKSVWIIGERSFGSCGSLDTIYCYSEDFPVIRLTYLDVVVNMEMIFSYDADAPYIYDNTILYVPCQLLDAYKSQEEYTIRFPNIQCLEEDTPSQPQDQPTEGIGVFSIGEGKTVTFSPGNLQYTQSTDTWSFARVQYEVIGTNNVIGGSVSSHALGKEKDGTELADKIDLFGWSTSANNFGVTTSTKNNDYSGSFVDWGTNKIGNDAPNTWRTLTNEEWDYLLNNRKNASSLCGIAKVKDVNGLIILPDNWICPADITFKSGGFTGDGYFGVISYDGYQTFSVNQWSKLEAAGAIFLPAAGSRYSNSVHNVQYLGRYWSATECNNNQTYYTHFDHSEVSMNNFYRYKGHSVRLVKDVNSTTPEPPIEPETEWITIYIDTVICEYDLPFNWHVAGHTMICETAGTYTHEEIVEDENYIYHYIYTLELTVIPFSSDTIVVEAYDSYEWHGKVYTESGTYIHEIYNFCSIEVLELTIIDTPTPPEPPVEPEGPCSNIQELDWKNGLRLSDFSAKTWYKMYVGDVKGSNFEVRWINDEPCVATWTTAYLSECLNTTDWSEIEWESLVTSTQILDLDTTCAVSSSFFDKYSQIGDYIYVYVGSKVLDCDSEPQDTTIYHPTDYATICEGEMYTWMGVDFAAAGMFISEEIVEEENYTYHHIYTLELTVLPSKTIETEVEAYDSYEWHGKVYTESGTYIYEEYCYQEILHLTIIPSEEKEYLYIYLNELICDGYEYRDPITGIYHIISSFFPYSLTWSDTITGTEVDTIYTFYITPIVAPEPLTEDMLYAIGAVPKLVAGEKVDIAGTTELIMAYYQKHDKNDIADVIGVEWVSGHDVVLDTEQTTHTMVLEVWADCDYIIPMEFTFPVSKKDSEPQDTTIYHPTEYATICEGETYIWWMGKEYTETGTYTYAYEEIVEEDDYIYHYYHIFTLELTVIAPMILVWPVEAYDSYEWHGVVYTESGTYLYEEWCYQEILELTIIPSTETAVDNMQTDSDHSAQKILRDQQLLILRDGKTYTIMGAEIH